MEEKKKFRKKIFYLEHCKMMSGERNILHR